MVEEVSVEQIKKMKPLPFLLDVAEGGKNADEKSKDEK